MKDFVPAELLEARWSAWLLDRNRRGTRSLLWIAVTLYPLFGVLDYLVAPRDWLWLLYSTRLVVTLLAVALFRVLPTPFFARHANVIASGYLILGAGGVSLMTVFLGGLASPYYAGLSLIIVATGLLFVWPAEVALVTHGSIVTTFIVVNAATNHVGAPLSVTLNLAFLVSTATVITIGQVVLYGAQREQVAAQLVIERTKANLERAHDKLKQLDQFKTQFFANVTHELQTPLTMILAPLELMVDDPTLEIDERQRQTLRSMYRSGVKLLKLLRDLLDLSRLEESRLRLRVAEHDLVPYCEGLLGQVMPLAQRKAIELTFASGAERAMVHCDLERLERVFVNLLSNATKFTPPQGHVRVTLEDEGASVRIDVKDDGPGFPSAMRDQVFERFFQVNMASTRQHGGTGIGLALAKELVELHGGEIWAESEEGAGATFSVRLVKDLEHFPPGALDRRASRRDKLDGQRAEDRGLVQWAADEASKDTYRLLEIEEATEKRVIERDADEGERPYTALVVEDTLDVLRVIHLALRRDFKVLAARDGRKGLELAIQHMPDLVITDLMMPEIDGLELTRRLRADARTRNIPIVMLTARGDLDDRVAGLETGVNAYLTKPFSTKELVSTVRALVDVQRRTAELMLTDKMDSLESIAGGLAHEINNPLNYVKSSIALLREQGDALRRLFEGAAGRSLVEAEQAQLVAAERRTRRLYETAEGGVRRIATTVDLMRRYSREGYARVAQPYDLFAAVRDTVDLVLPATGRDVRVEVDVAGDGVASCVPEEMNQLLSNLVQNAIEASPEGEGVVRVVGRSDATTVSMSVRDNGPGIKPEDRAKVFTPFYSTKEPGRGMGMGLTIVHRVATRLGGTVSVGGQSGQGAEFTVRIPRGGPATADPAAAPGAPSDADVT